jgi:outer membrane receptor for ferrienterochelin and colicin
MQCRYACVCLAMSVTFRYPDCFSTLPVRVPKMSLCRFQLFLFVVVFALTSCIAVGQASRTTGTIQGTVLDQSGGAVVGAQVQLSNLETNQQRSGTTGPAGDFLFTDVAVGGYRLVVEASDFSGYQNDAIESSLGRTTFVMPHLVPAKVQQQVSVSDEGPPLDVTQTTFATTVGHERIEESPVVSRNYLNFVLLAPSLSPTNNLRIGTTNGVLADSGFTFAGLRPRSNSLYIDGVENNDEFEGSVRTELSPETIHEFQVVNNGLSAESGGGAGGSINVVTKSGTNIYHGDAFLFVQSGTFNAKEALTNETTKPSLDRERAGVALGGPIIHDRTFFYAADEQERSRGDDASFIEPSVASTINSALSAGAYQSLSVRSINPDTFNVERAETEASGRLDHQINNRNSLFVKCAFMNNREVGSAFNVSGLVDPSGRGSSFTRDQGATVNLNSILGGTTVNSASVQISRRAQVLRTGDETGPGIDIAGVVQFGRPFSGNSSRTEDHYEAVNTLSTLLGRHLFKVGVDVDNMRESAAIGDGLGGYYIFPTLRGFLNGLPDEFIQSFGSPRTQFGGTRYAGFFQEHVSISRRLTFDAGVRYEFEQLPASIRRDTNNVAPRFGVSFSPSDKWVLRVGFGMFYDRYLLAAVNRVAEWNGAGAFQQIAYGGLAQQIFVASQSGTPTTPTTGIAPSLFTSSPSLATPYSVIASAGVERQLTKNATITATYLFSRGIKLPRTVNVNLPPPLTVNNGNAGDLFSPVLPQVFSRSVFGLDRLNPRYSNVYQWQNQSSSTYHGLSIALNRRLANEIEFSGSYTLSKTLDDASDFTEQPQNSYDIQMEHTVSANDQRHRFVFSGTFDLPFGDENEGQESANLISQLFGNIEAAPIMTIGSGRPIDPLVGFDANRNGSFPLSSRPLGFARNSLHTSNHVQLDLRLLKYFKVGEHGKLDLVAESFNLLNQRNVLAVNPFFGPDATSISRFGKPDKAGLARQFQFSIDFEF